MTPTPERFRRLARSSPWRWDAVSFALTWPITPPVTATVVRPDRLRVVDAHGLVLADGVDEVTDRGGRRPAPLLDDDGRFEVRIAANGFDAGMMVKEYRPDIIILDVMLPDINGKEVCHRVRSDNTLEEVRIICISGMVEEDRIQELKLAGADDFVRKPFDVDELIDRMCQQLEMETAARA